MGVCISQTQSYGYIQSGEVNKSMFVFKYAIGNGSFGPVWKVEKKPTNVWFIVNMHYSFQEKENLYLVSDFMVGGDLRYHLKKKRRKFTERQSLFIIACIVLGLEYLHNNLIKIVKDKVLFIHRDIRPENVLIDARGYCKITDFGLARVWQPLNSSDTSGTPGYAAPEVLNRQNHGTGVDYFATINRELYLFAVGVIAHELMLGERPWRATDRKTYMEQLMQNQVVLKKADTPESWNHEASDFINKCILRKPQARLGLNGPKDQDQSTIKFIFEDIKSHVWFKDFDWALLMTRKMNSPFIKSNIFQIFLLLIIIPNIKGRNFDKKSLKATVEEYQFEGPSGQIVINPTQERLDRDLINDPSFQQLFMDYRYDIDMEKRKEQEMEEQEKQRRNAGTEPADK